MKATAVLLHVSGLSVNLTAKLLGVSTPTMQAWLEQCAAAYAQRPEPEGRAVVLLPVRQHYTGKDENHGSSGTICVSGTGSPASDAAPSWSRHEKQAQSGCQSRVLPRFAGNSRFHRLLTYADLRPSHRNLRAKGTRGALRHCQGTSRSTRRRSGIDGHSRRPHLHSHQGRPAPANWQLPRR